MRKKAPVLQEVGLKDRKQEILRNGTAFARSTVIKYFQLLQDRR
jgi:hypothetical protein